MRLEASEHAHSTKEIGRLCFYLVFVWAEHRKLLPYTKSDRHQRSLWSRLAADEVREDSQDDPPVGVHCSRCARLFLIIFCNLLVSFFTLYRPIRPDSLPCLGRDRIGFPILAPYTGHEPRKLRSRSEMQGLGSLHE